MNLRTATDEELIKQATYISDPLTKELAKRLSRLRDEVDDLDTTLMRWGCGCGCGCARKLRGCYDQLAKT